MSFRTALDGKMIIGTFSGINADADVLFQFDFPGKYIGKINPKTAVVFFSVEDFNSTGDFRYVIYEFTTSHIQIAASFRVDPEDILRLLIID